FLIAYAGVAEILKVNTEILNAKENPINQPAFDRKAVFNYLFKHAQADERTQLEVLHSGGWSLDLNRCLSLRDFFGQVVHHSVTPPKAELADEKSTDKITNKYFS